MSDISDLLKSALEPKGTAPVVPIGWHCSTSRSAYFDKEFVHQCIDEIDRVVVRMYLTGQKATPLEQLAIMLISESAYFEDVSSLGKAVDEFRARQTGKLKELCNGVTVGS